MQFNLLHPADQIIMIMERIYRYGMTTTSGGNLSIIDDKGDIWISPASVDKGSLTRADVVCVKADGTIVGKHRPSSEFPFHQMMYKKRPDLKAVVHAHPPALVAFSIARKIPNIQMLPNDHLVSGEVGMADYALPGSALLGEEIASVFAQGIRTVMMENHGIVAGGVTLFEAFQAFETLEYTARLEINGRQLGKINSLTVEQQEQARTEQHQISDEFQPAAVTSEEREVRRDMCAYIHRSYDQRLFTSTQGTFSQRLSDGSIIITPTGKDRKYLAPEDLVRVENGAKESGKVPSRSVKFHQAIYDAQPDIHSIIIAHPPNIMAFAITDMAFDSRTIPESYILLRNNPKVPFGATFLDMEQTAKLFVANTPMVIAENDCVIVTGSSMLNAFDRLEVAEYSAKAILAAQIIGDIIHIDEQKIKDIDVAFNLL
ncbi:MAG: class II aldolase/adducin family protein [Gorillibacterium sp.]|nr:class II aldolase/adducin family protein [Gorillibacterium sp.]